MEHKQISTIVFDMGQVLMSFDPNVIMDKVCESEEEKYKISYSEDGEDSGAFADIPFYFDKSEGDIVKLKVRKQYLKDDLYKIEAIEIVD